jgi:hypothetical protein
MILINGKTQTSILNLKESVAKNAIAFQLQTGRVCGFKYNVCNLIGWQE